MNFPQENKKKGYIKYFRSIVDWEWYTDIPTKVTLIHLLGTVEFKHTKWRGISLKPGQTITSLTNMASKSGLSVQQIRSAIKKLKATREITCEPTNNFTLITLCNWDLYQSDEDEATRETTRQVTHDQQTDNKRITNEQQHLKKERTQEEKNISNNDFSNFYLKVATTLKDVLQKRNRISIPDSVVPRWVEGVRKLHEIDLKEREDPRTDILRALNYLDEHGDEEFAPSVKSGSEFRIKFSKIEEAIKRLKKNETKGRSLTEEELVEMSERIMKETTEDYEPNHEFRRFHKAAKSYDKSKYLHWFSKLKFQKAKNNILFLKADNFIAEWVLERIPRELDQVMRKANLKEIAINKKKYSV